MLLFVFDKVLSLKTNLSKPDLMFKTSKLSEWQLCENVKKQETYFTLKDSKKTKAPI